MRIWVDADACPRAVKDLLFRAAERVEAHLTLVANQFLRTPPSPYLHSEVVGDGFDAADKRIVELTDPGDLVVTADVPLAAEVIKKGARALNPRGEVYTEENIGDHLATRNLLNELRSGGMETGGPPSFTRRDRQAFANALDRLLAKRPPDR
jgi:uncharacterized protein YaiI (UPF0178 family)